MSQKGVTFFLVSSGLQFCQMPTDSQNSFLLKLDNKFVMTSP